MDELIRQYPTKIATLAAMIVAGVIGGLYKMGWLRVKKWDGSERRECAKHEGLQAKVCSLATKLDAIDGKLDTVSEKMNYMLGALEQRWAAGAKK